MDPSPSACRCSQQGARRQRYAVAVASRTYKSSIIRSPTVLFPVHQHRADYVERLGLTRMKYGLRRFVRVSTAPLALGTVSWCAEGQIRL
jgi:hypothetical protein